eukprot:11193370-Heterocapsa_arctica.AAC.1
MSGNINGRRQYILPSNKHGTTKYRVAGTMNIIRQDIINTPVGMRVNAYFTRANDGNFILYSPPTYNSLTKSIEKAQEWELKHTVELPALLCILITPTYKTTCLTCICRQHNSSLDWLEHP